MSNSKQNDFHEIKGHRVFYSKLKNGISLGLSSCMCASLLVLSYSQGWKSATGIGLTVIAIGFMVFQLFTVGGRLFSQKPVMILSKGELYYVHTNTWYDVRNYRFEEKFISKYNYSGTFCMFNKSGERIISETNWHLEGQYKLLDLIRYIQIVDLKERIKSNPE